MVYQHQRTSRTLKTERERDKEREREEKSNVAKTEAKTDKGRNHHKKKTVWLAYWLQAIRARIRIIRPITAVKSSENMLPHTRRPAPPLVEAALVP